MQERKGKTMIKLTDVHGSKEASAPLIIGVTTVYVHTNIRQEPKRDHNGEVIEGEFEYIYDEVQYDKDEYIHLMSEKMKETATQGDENRADIDFLMLLNETMM